MATRKTPRPGDGGAPQINWRYSRKRRHVRITIRLPLSAATALRRHLLDDGGAEELRFALWSALDQALRKTPGRNRPLRRWLKECAAAAYLYVGEQYASRQPASLPLRRAERECRARVAEWPSFSFLARRRLLAAVLVRSASGREWKQLRLKDPLAKPEQTVDGFYRKHILPGLPAARRNPQRRDVIASLLAADVPPRFWWRAPEDP